MRTASGARRDQGAERLELDIGPDVGDVHDAEMGVGGRAAEPGEVLDRGAHRRGVMCLDEGAGVRGHHRGVRRETAPDRGDARVVRVDGEVDDRGQVEGHTNIGERLGDLTRGRTGLRWSAGTEVRGRPSRGEAIGGTQPRNLSALLVDGHQQRRRCRGVGQRGDQAPQLIGRLDVSRATAQLVAAEEDDSAECPVRDELPDRLRVVRREAAEADDQHLTDALAQRRASRRGRGRT